MMILVDVTKDAFWFVLLVSAIPLGASALIGLVIAILQTATQIQEQTFLFAVKFFAVALTIWLGGLLAFEELSRLSLRLFGYIGAIGKL